MSALVLCLLAPMPQDADLNRLVRQLGAEKYVDVFPVTDDSTQWRTVTQVKADPPYEVMLGP